MILLANNLSNFLRQWELYTVHYQTKFIVKKFINLQLRLLITTAESQRIILNKYYVLYIYIFTLHFNNTQNKHFQIKVTNMQQVHYFVIFQNFKLEFKTLSVIVFMAKQTILCVCV